jgi:hypothetical protein
MEGRDTPSRGLDTVAKFLAVNLSALGLQTLRRRRHVFSEDRLAA